MKRQIHKDHKRLLDYFKEYDEREKEKEKQKNAHVCRSSNELNTGDCKAVKLYRIEEFQ